MTSKLSNIQGLRAIAVLLVLAVHIQYNEARTDAEALLTPWLLHGVAGVDLFFVISGFVMVWITSSPDRSINIARFLFNRAARIYPAAWLWTTVAILGFAAAGTLGMWLEQSGLVFSYLLLPQENPPLLGVSWTLIHELYFYAVFAGLLLLPRRLLPLGLAGWGLIIVLAQLSGIARNGPWTSLVFHPLTFEFLGGAFLALAAQRWRIPHGLWIAAAGAIALLCGAIWLGLERDAEFYTWWGRVMAFGPGAVLLVLGLVSLEQDNRWTMPGWMVWLGDISYTLYLSHLIVISTLARIWSRVVMNGPLDNLAFILVMSLAPVIVAHLAYRFFEKPVLAWSKQLGRRWFG